MSLDLISSIVAFALTLMVLSYLVGDNSAFRLAVHVFVGVAAGYVATVSWWQVLWPKLILPLLTGTPDSRVILVIPMILSGFLLMKTWPSLRPLGSPSLGLLVGIAAAAAVGGAVGGTLVPQSFATIAAFGPDKLGSPDALFNGVLVLVGLVTSLAYFHFGARLRPDGSAHRPRALDAIAAVGGIFIAITLAALFAGVYAAALTAMIERVHFLGSFLGLG